VFTLGIVIGLVGAVFQALSYLFTRRFVMREHKTPVQILALGHVWMMVFSICLLPLVWKTPKAGWGAVRPVLQSGGFYLLGQACFFWTLRHIAASRASPLLGGKLLFVAAFGVFLFGQKLTPLQGVAIVLTAVSVFLLNRVGGALGGKVIFGFLLVFTGYALSDLSIPLAIAAMDHKGGTPATLLAVALTYIVCGVAGLAMLARVRGIEKKDWAQALPFAVCWYGGMACFFESIELVGVMFAVILQSTRALVSLALGEILSRRGLAHIEQKVEFADRLRQGAATLLMCGAIALYVLGKT
jgi:drug/metabolite transporter (DMT)-like permease